MSDNKFDQRRMYDREMLRCVLRTEGRWRRGPRRKPGPNVANARRVGKALRSKHDHVIAAALINDVLRRTWRR